MRININNQSGFSLIELMVVVAIIGILATTALPQFNKYQAKSKSAEAKLQLSAAYTSQIAFFNDNDTYGTCLSFMGYDPVGESAARFYAVGLGSGSDVSTLVAQTLIDRGADGCLAAGAIQAADIATVNMFPAGRSVGTIAPITTFAATDLGATNPTAVGPNTFVIGAVGHISRNIVGGVQTPSRFSINQAKLLRTQTTGY